MNRNWNEKRATCRVLSLLTNIFCLAFAHDKINKQSVDLFCIIRLSINIHAHITCTNVISSTEMQSNVYVHPSYIVPEQQEDLWRGTCRICLYIMSINTQHPNMFRYSECGSSIGQWPFRPFYQYNLQNENVCIDTIRSETICRGLISIILIFFRPISLSASFFVYKQAANITEWTKKNTKCAASIEHLIS